MNAANTLKKLGIEQTFNYIYKDPDKNMNKIMDWADKFSQGQFSSQRKMIREAIENPKHPYYPYIRKLFKDVDPHVTKTLAVNFFINAALTGWPKEEKLRQKYNCNIPWAILLDPTSACNLHCTGCWAAEYGHKLNLTYDEIDDIICQGKELGVYQKVIHAMELLRKKKLIYGISCCYTSANYNSITSEEFYDSLIDLGAYFVWYFHYMPVGNDAAPQLLPTPEQRIGVYEKIRKYRATKPLFAMDFQNDAEYVGGCIAGGRRYLHINANGDIDPCVFIHYSDSNIREKTLLQALRSPMLMAYHANQPFNENMLRPCPMLENPQKLRAMVNESGAHSTDLQSPESAEHLCAKCDNYAKHWKVSADKLWQENKKRKTSSISLN